MIIVWFYGTCVNVNWGACVWMWIRVGWMMLVQGKRKNLLLWYWCFSDSNGVFLFFIFFYYSSEWLNYLCLYFGAKHMLWHNDFWIHSVMNKKKASRKIKALEKVPRKFVEIFFNLWISRRNDFFIFMKYGDLLIKLCWWCLCKHFMSKTD